MPVSILSSNHQHPGNISPHKDEISSATTQFVIRPNHQHFGLVGEGHGHFATYKQESVSQQEGTAHKSTADLESQQNRTNPGGISEGCHQALANDVQEQVVTPVRAQLNGASRIFQPITPHLPR